MLDESTTLHGASSPESARVEQLRRKPPESPERVSGKGQEATRQVARLVIERPQEATHLELLIPSDSVAPGTAVDRAHCSAVAEASVPALPRCARRFNGSPGPGRRRPRTEARLVDAGASTEGREGQRLATLALRGSEGRGGARRRSGGSGGAAEPEEAATRVARDSESCPCSQPDASWRMSRTRRQQQKPPLTTCCRRSPPSTLSGLSLTGAPRGAFQGRAFPSRLVGVADHAGVPLQCGRLQPARRPSYRARRA